MEWQPIETAPKNGDDLWLYQQGQEPEQFVGYFCSDGCSYWAYRERLVNDVVGEANPTHWMPLPPPPSK